jgi:hypothetical protein
MFDRFRRQPQEGGDAEQGIEGDVSFNLFRFN